MEKWEAAARKFIEQCDFYDEIEAVFLTGSYVAGNADEYSDIDLYIVLNDNLTWRERGNKRIDGFLIEYFANPVWQIKKYIDSSYNNVNIVEINMILNGIVIFDKNSAAESMRKHCLEKDINNFPALHEFHIQTGLYGLWDEYDELTRAYNNKTADFAMQYFVLIKNTFAFYSKYIGSPVPNYHKLYKWLTSETYREGFKLPTYRDSAFLNLILNAFERADMDAMFVQAGKVKDYVFDKLNGFDIDNYKLKGPCGNR